MKHLDSEYRNRYEEYYLEDGTIKDSRQINWRDVEWEKVKKIVIRIKNRIHLIDKRGKKEFKGFMRFRWGGREAQHNAQGQFIGFKMINIWTFGWTNGQKAYLKDIDFKNGMLIKTYDMKLEEVKGHIHPRLNIKL